MGWDTKPIKKRGKEIVQASLKKTETIMLSEETEFK